MLKITLPFVDLRGKTPIDLLRSYPDRALPLVHAARYGQGALARGMNMAAFMAMDRQSHRWLRRSGNPYLYEIETFADIVDARGVYALNLHYDWSCTSGIYPTVDGVSMLRVLDSPIPALGKSVMLTLQQGRAGDFYNLTWPGLAGVFSAMAPGRFVAAINMAPMRRYSRSGLCDRVLNRILMNKQMALPPSHLLRQVMELAPGYEAARHMLSHAPLAMPAIFTLSGVKPGEGCVIERLEDRFTVLELGGGQRVCASNHFCSMLAMESKGWRLRGENSFGRLRLATTFYGHDLEMQDFEWLQAPVINPRTRICMIANAASERLMLQGFEGMSGVTELFRMQMPEYQESHLSALEGYDEREAV